MIKELLLLPLAWLYAQAQQCRYGLYKRGFLKAERLPGKVVSIGNIEAGGTGKTPVVVALCRALRERGAKPVILTRGYRSGLAADDSLVLLGNDVLMPARGGQAIHADEAKMQAAQLGDVPVVVGAARAVAAARYLTRFPAPTHWILDDGFQHLKIERDLDIVLLDGEKPFGNGHCLPLGSLRERPGALRRADILIFTRAPIGRAIALPREWPAELKALPQFLVHFHEDPPRQVAGPPRALEEIGTWTLALGIARPGRIMESLERQGRSPTATYIVGDHESFDFERLRALVADRGGLLTTEKDYWRASEEFAALELPVYVLPLSLEWPEPDSLSRIIAAFT